MDDLYRDYILEHYRRPHNFGVIEDADASYEGANPLCGDRITLMLGVKDGVVDRVGFTGRGCAISQASASLLTDEIKGKPLADVAGFGADDLLDLLGIEISPARLKCAMLSHESLQHVLDGPRRGRARRGSRQRPAHDQDRAPLQVSSAGLSAGPTTTVHHRPRTIEGSGPLTALAPTAPARRPSESDQPNAEVLRRPPSRGARPDQGSHAAGGRCPRPGRGHGHRRPRGVRVGAGPPARRHAISPRATSSSRSRRRRPIATPRSSSTAPAASARCSRPRRWPRWATRTSPRCRAGSRRGRAPASTSRRRSSSRPSRSSATAATC